MVYLFETQLHVPDDDYQKVNGIAGTISALGGIILMMLFGVVYDTWGRRLPMVISLCVCIVGQFMFPLITTEQEFYIVSIMLVPLPVLLLNPWIPDLIDEES